MALQNIDLFIVERAGVQYKMTADQIAEFVGAVKDFTAANIADRDAGTLIPAGIPPKAGDRIFVTDASGDNTPGAEVDAGWAVYRVVSVGPNVYEKIQEQESMDLVISASTNLAYTAGPASGTVTSDNGTNAIIPLVDGTNAGLASPQMFNDSHVPAVTGLTAASNPINIVPASQELTFGITQLTDLP